MRRLTHLIILLLVFGISFKVSNHINNEVQDFLDGLRGSKQFEQATASLIFFPREQQWLEFSISERPEYLRILTNAVFPGTFSEAKQVWHYAIDFQLLDSSDRVLKQQQYHHRSQIAWVKNKVNENITSRRFLKNDNQIVASTGEIIIANNLEQDIVKVKLRLSSADHEISRVGFRLYGRELVPDSKIKYAWQSLSEAEKSHLARTNIYPPELLNEQEKYELLKQRWRPLGANGIDGENYLLDKLYVYQDEIVDSIEDEQVLPAISADQNYRKIFLLPEQGGVVDLQINPVNHPNMPVNNYNGDYIVYWYGKGLGKIKEFRLNSVNAKQWQHFLESGMLEIVVDRPVTIDANITVARESVKLPNQERLLRSYRVNPDKTLRYNIQTLENQATPLRIDVRKLIGEEQPFISSLDYRFFDHNNRQLSTGSLPFSESISHYDRPLNVINNELISEVSRVYLHIPTTVSAIEFYSEQELLLNVFNRPPDFPYYVHVPEQYNYKLTKREQVPVWFSLKPENHLVMQSGMDYQLSLIQPKPKTNKRNIYTESYQWQDYKPDKRWSARYLLNPRKEDLPLKKDSMAGVYKKLGEGIEHQVNLAARSHQKRFRPKLIFVKKDTKPINISFFYNGKNILDRKVFGTNGEVELPMLLPGKAKLLIKSSHSADFYLNHIFSKNLENGFIRRLSNRLRSKTLTFSYHKNKPEEVLSALFQSKYGNINRTRIQVSIEPVKRKKQSDFYTLGKRIFDIKPDNKEKIKVLNTVNDYVGVGRRIFIPLGNDLPIGKYKISVTRIDGPEGYFSLYQFSIGKDSSVRFFKTLKEG